ncbi:MAG: S8 family serine peptidase [Thermoplasmatota archaeon]
MPEGISPSENGTDQDDEIEDEKISKTIEDQTSLQIPGSEQTRSDWRQKLSLGVKDKLPFGTDYETVVVATNNLGRLHRMLREYNGIPYAASEAVSPENFDYTSLSYQDSEGTVLKEINVPGQAIPHIASQLDVIKVFEKPEIKTMQIDSQYRDLVMGSTGAESLEREYQDQSYSAEDLEGGYVQSTDSKVEGPGYNLDRTHNVGDVWDTGFDGEGMNIAIVDTGTDFSHADLINQWAVAPEGDYSGAGWPIMFDPGSMELYLTTNETGVNRTIEGGYPVGFENHASSRYTQTNFTFKPTTEPIDVVNETVYYKYQESHGEKDETGLEEGDPVTKNLKGVGIYTDEFDSLSGDTVNKSQESTSTDSIEEITTSPDGPAPSQVMDDDGWYTVCASSTFGENNSLKLDSSGNPHVSYYDRAQGALGYAYWDGSQWNNETVDNDGHVGMYTSLDLNESSYPKISYYDVENKNLKYASFNGTGWEIEVVDDEGQVGTYSALVLDQSERPHILYIEKDEEGKGNVKYASWGGSTWSIEYAHKTYDFSQISMVGGRNGRDKYASYYDKTNNRLYYLKWEFTNLGSPEPLDPSGGGMYSSITLNSTESPIISYYNPVENELKYAHQNETGDWQLEVVDGDGDTGKYTTIASDGDDNTHIAYFSQQELKYTTYDGTDWVFDTIDTVGPFVHTSMQYNEAADKIAMSYYAEGLKALRYGERDLGTGVWDIETLPRDMGKKDTGENLYTRIEKPMVGGWIENIELEVSYSVNDTYYASGWDITNLTLENLEEEIQELGVAPKPGDKDENIIIDITEQADIRYLQELESLVVGYDMSYNGTLPGPAVSFDQLKLHVSYEENPEVYHDLWINDEKAFDGRHWTGESYKLECLPDYTLTENLTIRSEDSSSQTVTAFVGDATDQTNETYMFKYPNIEIAEVGGRKRVDYYEDGVEKMRFWNPENYTFDPVAGTIRLDVDIPENSEIRIRYSWDYELSNRRIFEGAVKGEKDDQAGDELQLPERYISDATVFYRDEDGATEWGEENYSFDLLEGLFTINKDIPRGSQIDIIYQYNYVFVDTKTDRIPNKLGVHEFNHTHISNVTANVDAPTWSGTWSEEDNYKLDKINGTIDINRTLPEGSYINVTYEWGRVPGGLVREEAFVGTSDDDTGKTYQTEKRNIKNVKVYLDTELWGPENYTLDAENGTLELDEDVDSGSIVYITYDWEYYWMEPAFELDTDTGELKLYASTEDDSVAFVAYSGYNIWDDHLYSVDRNKGEITLYTEIEDNEGININYHCGGNGLELMKVEVPKMQYPSNDTWGQEHFWTIYNMTSLPYSSQNGTYKFGLSKANHLADLWGEHVGMIMIDSETPGVYDQILVDINCNYDFQDEKPVNKSSPLAFTEIKSYDKSRSKKIDGINALDRVENYEFAWMGNDAEHANIGLSAGLLYWVSDGDQAIPYADRYAEIFEYKNVTIPGQGDLVAFYDDAGFHGTSTATAAAGSGNSGIKNAKSVYSNTGYYSPEMREEFKNKFEQFSCMGTAPKAKVIGVSMLGLTGGSMEASWRFAAEGYDGEPGTGDEANINSNSWGSFVDNAGWFNYDRLAMSLSDEYPETVPVVSAGNQGNGYGTMGSPSASPGVISVGAGTDMAYRTMLGNDLAFLTSGGSEHSPYPWHEKYSYDGDPRDQRPYGDIAEFSSRGPNMLGQPGVDVFANGAFGFTGYPADLAFSSRLDGMVTTGWELWTMTSDKLYDGKLPHNNSHSFDLFSGTSLSAPITSGVTTLIYQAYQHSHGRAPTNDEVKQILMAGANDHGFDVLQQGAGWVNATRSVEIASRIEGSYSDTEYWAPGEFDGFHREGTVNLMLPGESEKEDVGLNTFGESSVTNVKGVTYEKTNEFTFQFDAATFDGTVTLARDAVDGPGIYKRIGPGFELVEPDVDGTIEELLNTTGFLKVTGMQDEESDAYLQAFNWQDENETINHPKKDANSKDGENGKLDGIHGDARCERVRLTWSMDRGQYVTHFIHNPRERIHEGLILQSRQQGYEMAGNVTIEAYEKVDWDWIDIDNVSDDGFTAKMDVPQNASVGGYQGAIEYEIDNGQVSMIPVFVNVPGFPTKTEDGEFKFGGGEADIGLYSNERIGTQSAFYDSRLFFLNYDMVTGPSQSDHFLGLVEQISENSELSMNLYGESHSGFSGKEFGSFSMSLVAESGVSSNPYWTLLKLSDYLRRRPTSWVILEVRCDRVGSTDALGERFDGRLGHMKIFPTDLERYNEPIGNQTFNVQSSFEIPDGLEVLVPESKDEKGTDIPIDQHEFTDDYSTFEDYLADAPSSQMITIPEGTLSFTFNINGGSSSDDYDLGMFFIPEDDDYEMDEDLIYEIDGAETEFVGYDGNPTASESVNVLGPEPGTYYAMVAGFTVASGVYDYDWEYYAEGESSFEARNVVNETIVPETGKMDTSFEIGWNLFDTSVLKFNKTDDISEGDIPTWILEHFEENNITIEESAQIIKEEGNIFIEHENEYLYFIDQTIDPLFNCTKESNITDQDGEISQWFIDEFENSTGIVLPEDTSIRKENNESFWIQVDGLDKYYLEVKELEGVSDHVYVYKSMINIMDMEKRKNRVETMTFASPKVSPLALVQVIQPKLLFDSTEPEVENIRPVDGSIINTANPYLSAEFEDEGVSGIDVDQCRLYIDGEEKFLDLLKSKQDMSYHVDRTLEDGEHVAEFVITDKAGNANRTYTNFTVDTQKPTIDVQNIDETLVTGDDTVNVIGSVPIDTSEMTYSVKDLETDLMLVSDEQIELSGGTEVYDFDFDIALAEEGNYELSLQSLDHAGNTDEKQMNINRDLSSPYISITRPVYSQVNTRKESITIKGEIMNIGDELGNVTAYIDGQEVKVHKDGSFVHVVDLDTGSNTIDIGAQDEVGNSAVTKTITVNCDTEAPEVEWDVEVDGDEAIVSGSVDEEAKVMVNGMRARVRNGDFEERISLSSNSENEIFIAVEDEVGNTMEEQRTLDVSSEDGGEDNDGGNNMLPMSIFFILLIITIMLAFLLINKKKEAREEGIEEDSYDEFEDDEEYIFEEAEDFEDEEGEPFGETDEELLEESELSFDEEPEEVGYDEEIEETIADEEEI